MVWLSGQEWLIIFAIVGFSVVTACGSALVPIAIIGLVTWYFVRLKNQKQDLVQSSASWRATNGRVLKSRVEVSGGNYATVSPYILYEYEVHGRTYQNTQIKVGDRFISARTSREAYDLVDRYPVGADVTVFYDPANPDESALER
ncbi:MAG: DUF3592 domain-containing protein [Anaerolineales bacterium]